MMLQRNLLYTGVTRGKRLVILLGQRSGGDRRQNVSAGGGGQAAGMVDSVSLRLV